MSLISPNYYEPGPTAAGARRTEEVAQSPRNCHIAEAIALMPCMPFTKRQFDNWHGTDFIALVSEYWANLMPRPLYQSDHLWITLGYYMSVPQYAVRR